MRSEDETHAYSVETPSGVIGSEDTPENYACFVTEVERLRAEMRRLVDEVKGFNRWKEQWELFVRLLANFQLFTLRYNQERREKEKSEEDK